MKIRTGFVSNSSASSFCIFGCEISEEDLRKLLADNGITVTEGEDESFSSYEYEDELAKKTGLEIHNWDYSYWVGKSWSTIGGEETGNQFKESVQQKLPGRECKTIQEAWMDG